MNPAADRGAMAILERAGHLRRGSAEVCPHEGPRTSNAILVRGNRRDMVLCPTCLRMFQDLGEAFRARRIGPGQVAATMLHAGYTRIDAARFVLELIAERLRVPLGFRKMLP